MLNFLLCIIHYTSKSRYSFQSLIKLMMLLVYSMRVCTFTHIYKSFSQYSNKSQSVFFSCVCNRPRFTKLFLSVNFDGFFMYSTHCCHVFMLVFIFGFISISSFSYFAHPMALDFWMHALTFTFTFTDVIRHKIGNRFATIVDTATTLLP